MTITLSAQRKIVRGFFFVIKSFFVEEAGCQAHEKSLWVRDLLLKKVGCQAHEHTLQVRVFVENCSLVHWALVTGLRDFLSGLLLVTLEGKWGSRRDC
jgi:hypothetical protein